MKLAKKLIAFGLVAGSMFSPGASNANLMITPVFDAGFNAADRAIINDAIMEWSVLFCNPAGFDVTINFAIDNALAGDGFTDNWNFDAQGRPTTPRVRINYNAHNWTLGAPAAGQEDALDTLKHEVGHALGFTVLGANFAAYVVTVAGNRFFDFNMDGAFNDGDFDLIDDPAEGTHAPAGSGDLMQPDTPLGERHHPTAQHAAVLAKAYNYVPEPSSIFLFLAGLFCAVFLTRKTVGTHLTSRLGQRTSVQFLLLAGGWILFQMYSGLAHTAEATTGGLRALVKTESGVYREGDPIQVSVRIENLGPKRIAILHPTMSRMLVQRVSNVSLVLVSSGGVVAVQQAPLPSAPKAAQEVLPAGGGFWETNVNALEIFGPLAADVYTVFVRYRASRTDFASQVGQTAADPYQQWTGQIQSDHLKVRVLAQDSKATVNGFVTQWLTGTDSGKKLRALWWLKNNALTAGMSKKQVEELLGRPATVREGGYAWVYQVKRTGIVIMFDNDAIKNVSEFET